MSDDALKNNMRQILARITNTPAKVEASPVSSLPHTDTVSEQMEAQLRADLGRIFAGLCKNKERHDRIITLAARWALGVNKRDPLPHFATALARKLQSDEALIIGWPTFQALGERTLTGPFQRLQQLLAKTKPALASQPVIHRITKHPLYLVVAPRNFRCSEITRDVWLAMHPQATVEERAQNDYVVACMRVADNIETLGLQYSATDILDCLNLIPPNSSFFLRGLLLLHAEIEPKPFVARLEAKGFEVGIVLDEEASKEDNEEYDFLARFQGLLISKNPEAHERGLQHLDFLIELCRQIPVPAANLTGTGQVY